MESQRPGTFAGRQPARPETAGIVVLDGSYQLRMSFDLAALLREGPAAGLYFLCLDETAARLPTECRQGVVQLADDDGSARATLLRPGDEHGRIAADAVSPAACETAARALAPVIDAGGRTAASSLPSSVRLLDAAGLEPPDPQQIQARWAAGGRTTQALLGLRADGPFVLDLAQGPHLLVAGTTGSGKSELLQTLVSSLAVANRPDAMNFVLIDYKGGAAFRAFRTLPHTAGMLSDLDEFLVERALVSLRAELQRRKAILDRADKTNIQRYWDALPRPAGQRPAAAPGHRGGRVRGHVGEAAGAAGVPDRHRQAGPVPGHPPGARHPAAGRRGHRGPAQQHQPADRAAGRVAGGQPGRDRHRGRRPHPGRGERRAGVRVARRRPSRGLPVGPGRRPAPGCPAGSGAGGGPVALGRPGLPAADGRTGRTRPRPGGPARRRGDRPVRPGRRDQGRGARRGGPPAVAVVAAAARRAGRARARHPAGRRSRTRCGCATGCWTGRTSSGRSRPSSTSPAAATCWSPGRPSRAAAPLLRTLAGGLAAQADPDEAHLYVLDGGGALAALSALPHCGAVVTAAEPDRVERLLGQADRRARRAHPDAGRGRPRRPGGIPCRPASGQAAAVPAGLRGPLRRVPDRAGAHRRRPPARRTAAADPGRAGRRDPGGGDR